MRIHSGAVLSILLLFATPAFSHDDDDDGALDILRAETIFQVQTASNFNCGDFRTFLNEKVEINAKWYNPGVGVFSGHTGIDEYYQLVLPLGGGCGNAFGFQLAKLASTTLPSSLKKVGDNSYEAHYHLDAFFNALPPFDGNTWEFSSYGHLFKGFYNFTAGTNKLNYFVTNDLGNEVIFVGDEIAGGQQSDPFQWCGLMSVAQNIYLGREGYYPSNVTGFDFNAPTGFADCIGYHTFLTTKGATCGTNLVDHTAGCFLRHILTYLTDGASASHALHWAKLSHGNTKCLDSCTDVLATCSANASPIPENSVNVQQATFDYSCTCPVGYKGDALASGVGCAPVTCTKDANCKPKKASYCDSSDGLCKPLESFKWDSVNGVAVCPEEHSAWYNVSSAQFDCVREDKCWDARECHQQPNRVTCQYPGNLASPFGVCVCNAGFDGGYNTHCECPHGKSETTVSHGFKVCLAPGECTMDCHCEHEETCSSFDFDVIGNCI